MRPIIVLFGVTCLFLAFILINGAERFSLMSPQYTISPATLTGKFQATEKKAIFNNQIIPMPDPLLAQIKPKALDYKAILGDQAGDKRIEIDLTNQRLYAYQGDQQVFNYYVSTGKWGRTPTGQFWIWVKLRYTKMEGGSKAINTYYYLPNVPYTMYFYNDAIPKWRGYGIHGTYWHNNFGHPMSHGCINMRTEEVEQLYYWATPDLKGQSSIWASADNPGTLINIYGQAPLE